MGMRGQQEPRSDKELVQAFQAGDQSAYDEIYRRYAPRVQAVCRRMLRNPTDVDEATQEAFLRSFVALGRFNGQYQLGAWLARIATNICLDQIRRKARTPETYDTPDEKLDLEPSDQQPELLVTEQIQLAEAMAEMQPLHAEALFLRAVEGLSHQEMSHQLDMSPQQVKSLLHRARLSFRRGWRTASGFLIAPWAGLKGFASRSRETQVHNLAGASAPMGMMTVERVAAGAVAAVLAMSGLSPSEVTDSPYPSEASTIPKVSPVTQAQRDAQLMAPRPRPVHSGTFAPQQSDETLTGKLKDTLKQTLSLDVHNEQRPTDESNDPDDGGLTNVPSAEHPAIDEGERAVSQAVSTVEDHLDK
jgi:RNA polymerase sigma-70 factor, ECF subfamily